MNWVFYFINLFVVLIQTSMWITVPKEFLSPWNYFFCGLSLGLIPVYTNNILRIQNHTNKERKTRRKVAV